MHIPLIVHHPEAVGARVSAFVQTVDIAPTIMEFLNAIDKADKMQGSSLLPLIRGEVETIRDFAIAGYFNFSWSIHTPEWSYIHWLDPKENDDPQKVLSIVGLAGMKENRDIWTCTPGSLARTPSEDELYDKRQDGYQLNNLVGQHPDVARNLYAELRDYLLYLRTG